MTPPRLIMIYGRDPSVMQTRAWVLEKSGSEVCLVDSLVAFEHTLYARHVSLAVLCYTLSAEDRAAALSALESTSLAAKTLILTVSQTEIPLSGSFQTHSVSEGPRALIEQVREMLTP